jgi:hemerythrin-like metal-binding protein
MALIDWKDEFAVGVEAVDHEHKQLIALINELHARLDDERSQAEVQNFFGEIHAAISSHFALEERIMQDAGYDDFAAHKADHERLLDEIREIMDRHWRGAYERYEDVLSSHLKDWFTRHFRDMDAPLHAFLAR